MTTDAQNLAQLQQIADDFHFTASRVGERGCQVRLEAADNEAAMRWAIERLKAPPADEDAWRKPPPHFTPDPRYQRQPQSVEEWDRHQDPTGSGEFRAKRRLAFAGDLADPRAPPGMALVSRWDVILVLGRLTWLEARFENTKNSSIPPSADVEVLALIHELRAEEGNSVTVLCDNPDFEGANNAVEVCGDWTGWKDRRFEGETLHAALAAAVTAYRASKGGAGE